jgi:hypothetical protein
LRAPFNALDFLVVFELPFKTFWPLKQQIPSNCLLLYLFFKKKKKSHYLDVNQNRQKKEELNIKYDQQPHHLKIFFTRILFNIIVGYGTFPVTY